MVRISSVCYYQDGQGTPRRSKYLEKDGSGRAAGPVWVGVRCASCASCAPVSPELMHYHCLCTLAR